MIKNKSKMATLAIMVLLSTGITGCAGCKGCNVSSAGNDITPTMAVTATVAPTKEPEMTDAPSMTPELTPEVTEPPTNTPTPEPSPTPTTAPTPTLTPTPVITVSENATLVGSVKMGDDVWYDFYDDGTLVVRGTGKTRDVNCNFKDGVPWYSDIEYVDGCGISDNDIKTIVISDGITGIGDWALSSLWNVEKISFPKSLTSIGFGAFFNTTMNNPQIIGVRNDITIGLHAFGSSMGEFTNTDLQQYATKPSPTPVPTATPLPNPDKPRKVATFAISDNITYEFWDNDVMYVKGTGDIPNQPSLFNLWSEIQNPTGFKFAEKVHTVIVDEGITSFGEDCFCGLRSVNEWYLPSTLINSERVGAGGTIFHGYFNGKSVTVKESPTADWTTSISVFDFYKLLEDEEYALKKEAIIIWE